jgi:hypothetical protein
VTNFANRVSAAQARNGTLFDVAVAKGDEYYRNMIAQMQQELKGDRSVSASGDLQVGCPCVDPCNSNIFITPRLTGTPIGPGMAGSDS